MALPRHAPPLRPVTEAMEERILHSADLGPLLLGSDVNDSRLVQNDDATATSQRHEIAFIDAALTDVEELRADLLAQQAAGRPIEIVTIDRSSDGLALITQTLAGRRDISAVHVLAHGSDGVLQLGNMTLDAKALLQRADEVAGWGATLTADADLLLYGCDVAQTALGRHFVQDLAALTGADVAASTDLTGAVAQGGNWTLEFGTGRIEAAVAVDAAGQQAWDGTLAVAFTSESSGGSSTAVNSYNFSHSVNGGSDRMLMVQLVIGGGTNAATSVSYNGAALTFLAAQTSPAGTFRVESWYLLAPPVGSGTVNIALTSSSDLVAGATSYSGVNQANPFGTPVKATGTNGAPSATVASSTGDMVVDIVGAVGVSGHSIGAGQTQSFVRDLGTGPFDLWGVSSRENGAASVVMSQSITSFIPNWASIAVEINQNDAIQITAAQDTYIRSGNTNNYGASTSLVVDRSGSSALGNQRALLQFDLSAIPAGATITGATLQMQATANGGAFNINVYKLTEAWVEGSANGTAGSANWTQRLPGVNWTAAGGTFDPTPVATLNTAAIGQHSWDLTSLVQAWYAGSTANNGIVIGSPDTGTTTITYDSSEGTTPPRLVVSYTIPLNTAAVLDPSKTPVLATVNEDAGAPVGAVGTLVSSLVDFATPAGQIDNVTDADASALLGIAVTAANTGSGNWFYSTNGGADWTSLGAVSDASARLLAADVSTRLYFQPGANFNGSLANAITFRAWDRSSGSQGGLANTTINGGATAFSTATDTASLTVNAVNDAPSGTNKTVVVNEDTAQVFSAADFGFIDPNDSPANALLAVRISTLPGAGTLTNNGLAVSAGQTIALADIATGKLVFTPVANANGSAYASFTFQVQDNGGTANGGVDLDPTPNTLTVDVVAANDAPVLAGANNLNPINEDPAINTGTLVSALIAGQVSDADGGAATGIAVIGVNNANGNWQYTTNGGSSWFDFGAPTAGAARLLGPDANTSVRFVPNPNWNGSVAGGLTFCAWDRSSGSAGGTANTSSNGGGTAYSIATASAGITVNSVNNAPTGTNNTIATNEDTPYVFNAAAFGYSDPNDSPANTLNSVRISTLPAAGALTNNGTAVSANQMITLADINAGRLVFTPMANASGAGYASFTFQVRDNGGTANGGVNLDPTPNTMVIDVVAVNDAPTIGVPAAQATAHNTALVLSAANGNRITVSDVDAAGANLQITLAASNGTLTLSGVTGLAFSAGADGTAAMTFTGSLVDINAALDGLSFVPTSNYSGAAGISVLADDLGNSGAGGPLSDTRAVAVTVQAATPLILTDDSRATPEDTPLNAVSVLANDNDPAAGTLTVTAVNGNAAAIGASILLPSGASVTMNANGTFVYDPNGAFESLAQGATLIDSFSYDVGSTSGGTGSATVRISINGVNDAPMLSGANDLNDIDEDSVGESGTLVSALISGRVTDVDSGAAGIAVTAVDNANGNWQYSTDGGTVWNDFGTPTIASAQLLAADADTSVRFVANPNWNGTVTNGLTFRSWDRSNGSAGSTADTTGNGGSTAFSAAMASAGITATQVNDAPSAANKTVSINEDLGYAFSAADFGFSDSNDSPADMFAAVRISILPGAGSLTVDGVPVSAGQTITVADIVAGKLVFTPGANATGAGHAAVTFQVQDDGGTANRGVDLDPTPNTITIDVTAVNDAPTGTDNTVVTNEDGAHVFSAADFGFSDPNDIPADALLAVRITTLPGAGSLSINGSAVSAGQSIALADIVSGGLVFTPVADATGIGYASFSFQVQDDGGIANGGVDLDPTPNTMTVDVTAVNDAPAVANAIAFTAENAILYASVPSASDGDDTVASYALVSGVGTGNGSLSFNADGSYLLDPGSDFDALAAGASRDVSFTYSATDSQGGVSAAATVTVTVNGSNDAAALSAAVVNLAEADTAATISTSGTFSISDVDSPASFVAQSGTAGTYGSFSIDAAGAWAYSASSAKNEFVAGGLYTDNFTVSSADGTTSSVTINIVGSNDPPVAATASASTGENTVLSVAVPPASDVDGSIASYALVSWVGAGNGSLTFNADGSYVFNPGSDFDTLAAGASRNVSFTYRAVDNLGAASAAATVTLTVNGSNDAPTLATPIATQNTNEDAAFGFVLPGGTFDDVDAGDTLSFTASVSSGAALPSWLTFDAVTRTFSGTPANADVGLLTVRVVATDTANATASSDFALAVVNTNDAPLLVQPIGDQAAAQDAGFSFTVPAATFTDADAGDTLTYSAALASGDVLPGWLAFDAGTRSFSGTPQAADAGPFALRVMATDSSGASAQALFVIGVVNLPEESPPGPAAPAPEGNSTTPPAPPTPITTPTGTLTPTPTPGRALSLVAPQGAAAEATPVFGSLIAETTGIVSARAPTDLMGNSRPAASRYDAVLADAGALQFTALESNPMSQLLRNDDLQRKFDDMLRHMTEASDSRRLLAESGVVLSAGLSIGYVVWLVRGGVLLSSMMSALPAWQMIDPMPVLAAARKRSDRKTMREGDEPEVERLFDGHEGQRVSGKTRAPQAAAATDRQREREVST